MRRGALLVNTGRGALIDARDSGRRAEVGQLGGVALDVYEEEDGLFGRDLSSEILADDVFARLLTFPNVVVTRATRPTSRSRRSRDRGDDRGQRPAVGAGRSAGCATCGVKPLPAPHGRSGRPRDLSAG
jgi:hypothetical protein